MWKSNYLALWTDPFEWRALDLPSFCYWNITWRHKSRGQRLHKVRMFAKIHVAKKYCFFIFFLYITVSWRRQDADVLIIKCHILLDKCWTDKRLLHRCGTPVWKYNLSAVVGRRSAAPSAATDYFQGSSVFREGREKAQKDGGVRPWALINTSP